MTSPSLPIRARITEVEETPPAPYAKLHFVPDTLFGCELDELIEHRPRDPRLETAAQVYIGRWFAARRGLDAYRVLEPRRHKFVQIGAEDQLLVTTIAVDGQRDHEEGHVFHFDAAAFGRGDQPITTIRFTAQNGCEELYQGRTTDGGPTIIPGAVTRDPHVEIAAIDNRATASIG